MDRAAKRLCDSVGENWQNAGQLSFPRTLIPGETQGRSRLGSALHCDAGVSEMRKTLIGKTNGRNHARNTTETNKPKLAGMKTNINSTNTPSIMRTSQ